MKNENGYTLLLTMLIIVVISVLGITLMTASSNTNTTIVNERTDQSTYYIAEAGINLEKAKIIEIISNLYEQARQHFNSLDAKEQQQLIKVYGSFDQYYNSTIAGQYCTSYSSITNTTICKYNNADGLYEYSNRYELSKQFDKTPVSETKVALNCHVVPCQFELSASGYFSDNPSKSRSLKQQLKVDSTVVPETTPEDGKNGGNNSVTPVNPLDNLAALTTGDITLIGGASINGSASTQGIVRLKDGASINGTIFTKKIDSEHYMNTSLQHNTNPIDMNVAELLPKFPSDMFHSLSKVSYSKNATTSKDGNTHFIIKNGDFEANHYTTANYQLNLQQQTRFNNFIIDQDQTIYLNVGDGNVDLYVNNFDIKRGHIKIIGSGSLNIYVNNQFNLFGSINNEQNPNKLNVFYKSNSPLIFGGDTKIFGTFYTQSSDLTLQNGALISGNIYSGGNNLTINGGVNTKGQYIVAPNAHLKLEQGGNIYGTVIAKSIYGDGGTKIHFGQPIVPLPTLPTIPQISLDSKNKLLIESSLLEQ